MSRRSIALHSSQQPLLQVQSQSKSNSSQSYALLSIALQRPVFCPPHASLTSVRVTLPRVTLDRSPAEPLHRRWHAPPRRLMTVMARVTLPRVTFDRSPAEPLHRRWHAPPRRLMTVMAHVTL